MFHGRFYETPASAAADALQFLGYLFELITLDDVAYLVFAEVAQLDSAFQTRAHFFHVVLETPQRRNAAIIDRLALSQDTSARRTGDAAIGDKTTRNYAFAQLENLFDLGVSDRGFAQLGFKQSCHGILDLIE